VIKTLPIAYFLLSASAPTPKRAVHRSWSLLGLRKKPGDYTSFTFPIPQMRSSYYQSGGGYVIKNADGSQTLYRNLAFFDGNGKVLATMYSELNSEVPARKESGH